MPEVIRNVLNMAGSSKAFITLEIEAINNSSISVVTPSLQTIPTTNRYTEVGETLTKWVYPGLTELGTYSVSWSIDSGNVIVTDVLVDQSAKYSISVGVPDVANCEWGELATFAKAGYGRLLQNQLGTTKSVTLNTSDSKIVTFQLVSCTQPQYTYVDTPNKYASVVFQSINYGFSSSYNSADAYMNGKGGYSTTGFYAWLPSDFKQIVPQLNVTCATDITTMGTYEAYFFLPAEKEILGPGGTIQLSSPTEFSALFPWEAPVNRGFTPSYLLLRSRTDRTDDYTREYLRSSDGVFGLIEPWRSVGYYAWPCFAL